MSGPNYKLMRGPDGGLMQAGLRKGPAWDATSGYIVRGVILATYYPDDPSWDNRGWAKDKAVPGVCCDVRVFGARTRTLYRVPVAQYHGVHDEDTVVLRSARTHISGGTLVTETTPTGDRPTEAQNLDGDWVLVTFIENDPAQPLILPFGPPHPGARHRRTEAEGRRRRIRHNGVLVEWDDQGNLLIDASGAAKPDLDANGNEQSNAGPGGTIRIKTTAKDVIVDGNTVYIGGEQGEASEPFVCGELWKSMMAQLIAAIEALTVNVSGTPSTVPNNAAAFAAIRATVESGAQLSEFIYGRKAK